MNSHDARKAVRDAFEYMRSRIYGFDLETSAVVQDEIIFELASMIMSRAVVRVAEHRGQAIEDVRGDDVDGRYENTFAAVHSKIISAANAAYAKVVEDEISKN